MIKNVFIAILLFVLFANILFFIPLSLMYALTFLICKLFVDFFWVIVLIFVLYKISKIIKKYVDKQE